MAKSKFELYKELVLPFSGIVGTLEGNGRILRHPALSCTCLISCHSPMLYLRSNLMNSLYPRPAVEITVKAQDGSNGVALHHSDMNSVAGRQRGVIPDDLTRS